jgi:hypothetical protein
VQSDICVNQREIVHIRLDADAGAGGAVYVMRCARLETVPRSQKNCTEEILLCKM